MASFKLGTQPKGSSTTKTPRTSTPGAFRGQGKAGMDIHAQETMTPDMETPRAPTMMGEPKGERGTQHPVFTEELPWPGLMPQHKPYDLKKGR